MCETSGSIPVLVAKVAKISAKKHKGLVVAVMGSTVLVVSRRKGGWMAVDSF